jgi:hypothetical protein
MTEVNNNIENIEEEIRSEKFEQEELYKATLSAFTNNHLELDKQVIAISTLGIVVSITYLTKVFHFSDSIISFIILCLIAILEINFMLSIVNILNIFKINKEYYKSFIHKNFDDIPVLEYKLGELDKRRDFLFISSLVISITISITIVIEKIILKG